MKDLKFAGRLAAARSDVAAAAGRYATAAASGNLAAASPFVLADIANEEMSKHYDRRFASLGSPGRAVYDKLRAFAGGRCPYCGQRPVNTLDHYWPKRGHAAVTLVPDNLVPACRDCNTAKGQYQPGSRSGELLHPYFDEEHCDRWLMAVVDRTGGGPVILYYADPPKVWPVAAASRVHEHLTRLELGALYSILAVDEVQSMRDTLDALLAAGDSSDVREHLSSRSTSEQRRGANSWRTALYEGLARDTWFWSGGFREF